MRPLPRKLVSTPLTRERFVAMVRAEVQRRLRDMRQRGFYYRDEKRYDPTTWDIDNGECEEFSQAVLARLPGGIHETDGVETVWLDDELPDGPSHCVLRFKGRFYDAEAPEGVAHLGDVPVMRHRTMTREEVVGRGRTRGGAYHHHPARPYSHPVERKHKRTRS